MGTCSPILSRVGQPTLDYSMVERALTVPCPPNNGGNLISAATTITTTMPSLPDSCSFPPPFHPSPPQG
eukprot:2395591-Pyramimonas_sp.AAC.1